MKKGKFTCPMNDLIDGHAVSLGMPLVTYNLGMFSRVQGLKVENWAGK